ncbi:MAG TPA: MFS transporter [Burkholderiaceae bacterium]|nr:MFS transporter [Burkholderiaceae bacterium]
MKAAVQQSFLRSPAGMLAAAATILSIALGIRHGFGLFLQPMSVEHGWGREVFAFAIAAQNLIWGLAQPVTGWLADRFGAARIILGGAALYALGLALMAFAQTPGELVFSTGLLVGLGLSGTTFAVVLGAVGRAVPAEKRSRALGIATAIGSFGQFVMLPGTLSLIGWFGWSAALLVLAALCGSMAALTAAVNETRQPAPEAEVTVHEALRAALRHRGFRWLAFGFFVCGFQVVFIITHLPAFLADRQLPLTVGTNTLALVGLANVAGAYFAGLWGARYRKPALLAAIYAGRAIVIAVFVWLPITEWSCYVFGLTIGLLWMSTVPLTNGTIASVFGVRNLGMLSGIIFGVHQVGAFLGGWLGGYLYDMTGNYDGVWMIAIGLSVIAALVSLPIREQPAPSARAAAQAI